MHTPPEKLGDIDLKIANMNRILHPAKIPLSLEYFWKYVGEVVFAPYNTGNDEYLQFWGSYISSWSSDPENIVPDSLWICGPGTIENGACLCQFIEEFKRHGLADTFLFVLSFFPSFCVADLEYMVNECRDEGTDDPYPVSLSLAPSHDSKAHVSGEGPVGFVVSIVTCSQCLTHSPPYTECLFGWMRNYHSLMLYMINQSKCCQYTAI
jgi:hypothetical protein